MRLKLGIVFLLSVFAVTACKKNVVLDPAQSKAGKTGVLTFAANELKTKGKKFDVSFTMTNEYKGMIIVKLNDMSCAQGDSAGVLKHAFFGAGERVIDLGLNQTKRFHLVCTMYGEAHGDYTVKIARVFENPGGDGKTTGKVLATDIVWTAPEEKS